MALKTTPMDPSRPKTPGWAFTAPQSAKNEKVRPPPFSSFYFAGTGSTERTSVCMNQEHAPKCALKPSTERFQTMVQTVGRLGCLQPLTA
jgi:hypothetical protein